MNVKDEFNYHAVSLVFGKKSPRIEDFQAYSFEILRRHPEIKYSEMSALTVDNTLDINRELMISPTRCFIANSCSMSSGTCRVITLVDVPSKTRVSDELFTTSEYAYFSMNWDDTVKNKIRTLGMLIRSVYEGRLFEIPLLINQFNNISGFLLQRPDVWAVVE